MAATKGITETAVEDMTCAICLETLQDPVVTLPCDHKFCCACLEGWRSKYSASNDRTCPNCRKKIPPSKEMIMQYQSIKVSRDSTRQMLGKQPYAIPTLPGEPDHDPYNVALSYLGVDAIHEIQRMSPEMQQGAMRMHYLSRLANFQEDLDRMRELFGDSLDAPLDDPSAQKVDPLPWDITNAAASNEAEVVLRWLGPRPIAPERINAKNPGKMDRTLLAEAVYEQHIGLMCYLLQEGAIVDPKNCNGSTPFSQACSLALEKSVLLLLEWGASNDLGGATSPQEYVLRCGNKPLAKLLKSPLGGRRCEMFGLQSRLDLNGKACILNKYSPKQDKYVVQVERTNEELIVKSPHLKRRDRTRIDCGVFYAFHGIDDFGRPRWSINPFLTEAEVEEMEREEKGQKT